MQMFTFNVPLTAAGSLEFHASAQPKNGKNQTIELFIVLLGFEAYLNRLCLKGMEASGTQPGFIFEENSLTNENSFFFALLQQTRGCSQEMCTNISAYLLTLYEMKRIKAESDEEFLEKNERVIHFRITIDEFIREMMKLLAKYIEKK